MSGKSYIHAGGAFADDTRRILAVAARAETGESVEPETHLSFQDWDTFFRVLTPARIALPRHVRAHDVSNARALAQAVGRDHRWFQADVTALAAARLIEWRGTALTTDRDGAEADFDVAAGV